MTRGKSKAHSVAKWREGRNLARARCDLRGRNCDDGRRTRISATRVGVLGVALAATSCGLLFPLDDYGPPKPSGDASVEPDAGGFCKQAAHDLCSDFDEGVLRDPQWTSQTVVPPGTGSLSTLRSTSSPAAFVSSMPRTSGTPPQFSLDKIYAAPFRRTRIEFDLYLEPSDWAASDGAVGLLLVSFRGNGSFNNIYLTNHLQSSSLGPAPTGAIGASLPVAQWIHALVDIDPGNQVTGQVGNQHYVHSMSPVASDIDGSMLISLGLAGFVPPTPAVTAYFDNVTIDFP